MNHDREQKRAQRIALLDTFLGGDTIVRIREVRGVAVAPFDPRVHVWQVDVHELQHAGARDAIECIREVNLEKDPVFVSGVASHLAAHLVNHPLAPRRRCYSILEASEHLRSGLFVGGTQAFRY